MQNDVYSNLLQDLNKGNICTLTYFTQKYSQLKQTDIIQTFIALYKEDRNQRFELLCHIAVVNDAEVRIQNQRYSNIQRGVLIDKSNSVNTYAFKREHIKELKILAIFPNQMLVSEVENMLEFPSLNKTKEYVNKCVVLPKQIVENIAMAKNKSKKEEKPEKSVDVKKETKGKAEEPKKGLKKTESKSSIESQPKVPAQIKKVSSKQQSQPVPVHTHYQNQREKVEEQAVIKQNPPKKKLCLDSDEDYYNPSDIAAQLNGINDKNVETDHSGKKEHEKMDVETENDRKRPVKPFIVDDDDEDDEEDIFAKMEQAAKVQPDNKSAISNATCPKTDKPKPEVQKKVQPQKQAPKPASKPAPKPPGATAKNSSLMGWIKTTK